MTFQKADIRNKEIPVTSIFLNFVKKKLLSWFNVSYPQVVQMWLSLTPSVIIPLSLPNHRETGSPKMKESVYLLLFKI